VVISFSVYVMEVEVGAVLSICAWWSCWPPNKATIIGTSFFLDRLVHSLILDSQTTPPLSFGRVAYVTCMHDFQVPREQKQQLTLLFFQRFVLYVKYSVSSSSELG
jgi:Mg2+ and Co2+ transporter CorA